MSLHPQRNRYGSGVGSPCWSDVGCTGTTPELIDNGFCSSCADYRANNHNWIGFHFTGYRNVNGRWAYLDDRPDNICGGNYDYWIHDGTPCGFCPFSLRYRCHDGYKSDSVGNHFTICHSIVMCNEVHQPTTC
jgi:hypothetical protein